MTDTKLFKHALNMTAPHRVGSQLQYSLPFKAFHGIMMFTSRRRSASSTVTSERPQAAIPKHLLL